MGSLSPIEFVKQSLFDDVGPSGLSGTERTPSQTSLNLDELPEGVLSGNTLIDFSGTPSKKVRSGVSLSMLFASRVATKAMKPGDTEDDWLAAYKSNLENLGFNVGGSATIQSKFKKTGVFVHEAIIPWLTASLGGAALGPIILSGLKNLKEMDRDKPWITLFDQESKQFNARELHFAAVSESATEATIQYAIARLNFVSSETNILFFKLTNATVDYESTSYSLSANKSLMAVVEPDLKERLANLSKKFILEAKF